MKTTLSGTTIEVNLIYMTNFQISVNLYKDVNSPRNYFNKMSMEYESRDIWFNGDKIYVFQKMGIWFISTTIGALSGFAYSRQGEMCPTSSG